GMPDDYRLTKPLIKYENSSNVDAQGRHGVGHVFCYYDKNCLTPGANMADVTTAAFASRGHKSWYQGLRYAANNRCTPDPTKVQAYESVAAAQNTVITDNQFDIKKISSGRDLHADLSLIDGKGPNHWGINYNGTCFPIANGYKGGFLCDRDSQNPKCDQPRSDAQAVTKMMEPFEYQMDAISSNWDVSYEAYISFYKYQLEWVTGPDGYVRWTLADAPIFEIPAATMTNPPQGTGSASYNPKKTMIEEPSYFIFNVAMSSAWGATPPNYEVGPCRGNATMPAPGSSDYNITNNICDSFPMFMYIDYIRVWQNTSTMSYGCDPASHPTKEFIKGHIADYTDPLNMDIQVAGRAMCNSDDDCTVATSFTGSCVNRRCKCADAWSGPRCTRYDLGGKSYGPTPAVAITLVVCVIIGCGIAFFFRLRRRKNAALAKQMQLFNKTNSAKVSEDGIAMTPNRNSTHYHLILKCRFCHSLCRLLNMTLLVYFIVNLALVAALDIGDTTQPTKSGIGTWIDVDTPTSVYNKTSSRGETWQLVMSDEFNLAGRNFTAGEDHLWVALDIPDGVNRAIEIYKPSNAYTKDGYFYIQVDSGEVDIDFYNVWADRPDWTGKKMWYTAAMVQTWNKFCLQGGFIEISMKLPGATNKESMNPHVVGKRWTPQGMVPIKTLDPIPDIRFYPTWPGLWLMGNLGRALFAASTNRMWPWTYNECTELSRKNQRISACDPNPGYGLHPNMGRGSPEIDILEGGGTAISSSVQIAPGMPDDFRLTKPQLKFEASSNVDAQGRHGPGHVFCFYDKTCLTPGANMADVTTAAFASRGHKSWYQGLRYAANNRCSPDTNKMQKYESVAAAQNSVIIDNQFDIKKISSGRDLHADLGLIDGKGPNHWGINYNGTCFPIANGYKGGFLCDRDSQNPKCDQPRTDAQAPTNMMEPFEYQMDAISSNWDISYEAYISFYKYQLEWVTGDSGYVRWTLADVPIFEIPAATMTNPPQGSGNASYNPKKIMIEEPSYFIFNVAMSSAWGATPPNFVVGPCRGNATMPTPGTSDYNISNNICDSFPMYMTIDYIRVWQDIKTMSIGCDPATHPTKEFIKGHILNYTDALNPDIAVAGGAMCNKDDDCTVATSFTGSCIKRRCTCVKPWTGPRCTRYDLDTKTYGPSPVVAISLVSFAFVSSFLTLLIRLRRREVAYQNRLNDKQNDHPEYV
ncbi:beta-glucan synthesis-associated protein, partial [Thraustotheca clavata]